MRVLGIESSCDETGAAIVDDTGRVLSDVVQSQISLHAPYGGVIPELASRDHLRNARAGRARGARRGGRLVGRDRRHRRDQPPRARRRAARRRADGEGPRVGARAAARRRRSPRRASARRVPSPRPASSEAEAPPSFRSSRCSRRAGTRRSTGSTGRRRRCVRELGATRDDAAGEAFDKVAKLLGLGYPGGPAIDRLAQGGDPKAVPVHAPDGSHASRSS